MVETPPIPESELAAPAAGLLVKFNPNDAAIAELKQNYASLIADPNAARTPEGYEEVRKVIGVLRTARSLIEKRRVELKADALTFGRKVDGEAKRLTGLIEEIEQPLKLAKSAVDDEKEKAKREAEEKERARILELERLAEKVKEDARKAALELEEADRKKREAELAAERERLAAIDREQQAERDRLAEERRKIEAAQREAQAKIDAEDRRQADERERLARIEFERKAKEHAEREARERVEREAREAEQARVAKAHAEKLLAEQEAAEQKRFDAAKPDVEKIRALGVALHAVLSSTAVPTLTTPEGKLFLSGIVGDLGGIVARCKGFAVAKRTRKAPVPA